MAEEFNLSEKAQRFELDYDFYCETDVKEFIKILKENLLTFCRIDESDAIFTPRQVFNEIDKLAGDKLL